MLTYGLSEQFHCLEVDDADERSPSMRSRADGCPIQVYHRQNKESVVSNKVNGITDLGAEPSASTDSMVKGDCSPPLLIRTKEKRKALWKKIVTRAECQNEGLKSNGIQREEDVWQEGLHCRRTVS